jgi:hypothetical protein
MADYHSAQQIIILRSRLSFCRRQIFIRAPRDYHSAHGGLSFCAADFHSAYGGY